MTARLEETFIEQAQEELRREGIDAWLLYDLEARNRVSAGLIGVPEGMSRRWFVRLTPEGEPHALVHSVEYQHWPEWPYGLTEYVSWGELEAELGKLLGGLEKVAMEVSEGDAVPWYDNVPAGVVQMVEAAGPKVVSSGPLISGSTLASSSVLTKCSPHPWQNHWMSPISSLRSLAKMPSSSSGSSQ